MPSGWKSNIGMRWGQYDETKQRVDPNKDQCSRKEELIEPPKEGSPCDEEETRPEGEI